MSGILSRKRNHTWRTAPSGVVGAILLYEYITSLNAFLREIGMAKLPGTEWLEEIGSKRVPVQTLLAVVLWLVCGFSVAQIAEWSWRRLHTAQVGQLGGDVRGTQERLADQDRAHAGGLQT